MIRDIIDENETVKVNSREVELLKEHFGGCFNNEGKFDLEKFRTLIGDEVNIIEENQGFNFLGKSYARMIAGQESLTVIRPDEEHNSKPENRDSENIYISGDNLDALKHLCKSYAGQVKCIYIDPPYNTGSDGFVYNDKFNFNAEELSHKLGVNHEQAEHILDMKKSSSASDSAWLTFMLPRLELAKDMLSKEGVIFISIDDNEQANLKLLCDEIFGVENFLANVVWKHTQQSKNDERHFSRQYNHLLVYARMIDNLHDFSFDRSEDDNRNYSNPDNDPKGLWRSGDVRSPSYRATLCYDIIAPNGNVIKAPDNGWRWSEETVKEKIVSGEIKFKEDNTGIIRKIYLCDQEGRTPENLWEGDRFGTTRQATAVIKDLFDGVQVFDTPKPKELIERALEIASDKDSLIMDFFSGSATTAHAVMELNAIDNGNRKYILVQLPEPCSHGSLAEKQGYRTIDEIGQERIRRAAKKIKEENPLFAGDLGFKHFTLESFEGDTIDRLYDFDMNAELNGNGILSKFGAKTVLTTWLCRDGYGLNPKVSEVKLKDYTAYFCGKHLYLLDADFYQEEMGELIDKMSDTTQNFNPDVIVVFGYGMGYSTRLMLDKNLKALAEARGNKISLDIRY